MVTSGLITTSTIATQARRLDICKYHRSTTSVSSVFKSSIRLRIPFDHVLTVCILRRTVGTIICPPYNIHKDQLKILHQPVDKAL